jgi:two-component system nitrate/nitrite response regulator NarL
MRPRLATIVVESRLLVREALKSLMAKHSYRVVCGVGSIADIGSPSIVGGEPKLAILGAQSADTAVSEAAGIRKLWPDSKIILLYEYATPADFKELLTSQIDGCVPLFASPVTLSCTLDMIVIRDVRVMVMPDAKRPVIQPAPPEESRPSAIELNKLESDGAEREDVSVGIGAEHHAQSPVMLQDHSGLSEREVQIVNGLVNGHANKVIARACDISEATVKVHMKSILRKIGAANRTQAAIRAKGHGYTPNGFNGRLLNADSARNAASITEAAIRSVATKLAI